MPPYYPVFLDLKARPCVIVGGGEVAEHKAEGLLQCQARVTVISPEVTPGIRRRSDSGELQWLAREYAEGDLQGVFLAIAATDQPDVNKGVFEEAAKERVILNVVDNTPLCTFIAPAVVRRGDITVALSTGGASPALARKMREALEGSDLMEYAHVAGVLSQARKELKRRGVTVDPERWQECIDGDLLALAKAGQSQRALEHLLSGLLDGGEQKARAV